MTTLTASTLFPLSSPADPCSSEAFQEPSSSRSTPWFRRWFDENYLLLYSHRDEQDARLQTSLILKTLHPASDASILDLACGEGRHAALFHQMGHVNIRGLDISETLIASGRKKYPFLHLDTGDMRQIPGQYDIILSLFTSFGYFETDRENEEVFHSVRNALHPAGVFWLDFLNPAEVETRLELRSVTPLGANLRAVITRRIENQRIIKDIRFQSSSGEQHYHESVRLFNREELEAMFTRSGFSIFACFGDYQGRPWRSHSPRTIVAGRVS